MRSIIKRLSMAALALMAAGAGAKDLTFAFVPAGMQYPFNVAVAKGFQDAARDVGAKSIVRDPKGSVERQGNNIDDLVAQKVDGIAVLALDGVVAQSWVDRVASQNLPFVAVATQIGDPQKRAIKNVYPALTALVASDEVATGKNAGLIAAQLLPKGKVAKVAIVEGAPGYPQVQQRTKGFKQGLDESGVQYKIVAAQPTDWTPEKGQAVCQNILTAHPDVDIIYNQADDLLVGCVQAVRAIGSKAKLIGWGGSRFGINAIKTGDVAGTVCISPEQMGRAAFKALYTAVTKPETPKAQFVEMATPGITKVNLASCPPEW